jgi:acetyltransferase-like isoleucine patch superfamily enzyme
MGTYIGAYAELDGVSIGRFCSIGKRLHIIAGRHPTRIFVSTHPAFFSQLKQAGFSFVSDSRFSEFKYADEFHKKYVVIGCDVWIGDDVSILDGVRIGHGAILAAGAVVVNDVLPYSIVAGVPARIIKKRFSDSQIEFLLHFKWWEQPWEWIAAKAELFNDIDCFIPSLRME